MQIYQRAVMLVDDWMVEYNDIFISRPLAVTGLIILTSLAGCFMATAAWLQTRLVEGNQASRTKGESVMLTMKTSMLFSAACLGQQGDDEVKPSSGYGRLVLLVGVTAGLLGFNIFTG